MERALHDPERGYYSRRVRDVGRSGDFSTSATLSPLLGRAVGGWLKSALKELPRVRDVIEIGPGNGVLMRVTARSLPWWTRRRLRWHLVETSPVLREIQEQTLRGLKPRWWPRIEEALAAADGAALIYHNELLDAFPCRLLEWTDAGWREVWVSLHPNETREELREMEPLPWSSALQAWTTAHPPPAPRQRVEVHSAVRDWLAAWTPHWQAGQMLTIDYGDVFPAVYHRRPRGTVRAYFMQQRLEGPAVYQNIGRQDLTADINFTDYRAWTGELGLKEIFFDTQAAFIRHQDAQPKTAADHQLLHPAGAGAAFKAVIHRR